MTAVGESEMKFVLCTLEEWNFNLISCRTKYFDTFPRKYKQNLRKLPAQFYNNKSLVKLDVKRAGIDKIKTVLQV